MQSTPAADRKGMLRAAELAVFALGHTSPNPVVGCCLVYRPGQPDERLLAEGFHRRAGDLHAEAAALSALSPEDRLLLPHRLLLESSLLLLRESDEDLDVGNLESLGRLCMREWLSSNHDQYRRHHG